MVRYDAASAGEGSVGSRGLHGVLPAFGEGRRIGSDRCACPSPLPRTPLHAAAYSVRTVLQSIQSLLADPNNDSPLNVQAAKMWDGDVEAYRQV